MVGLPLRAAAAVLTGTVIGQDTRPVAGAKVEVVRDASGPRCETTTAADGTFSLPCDAAGRHVVRASFRDLRPWEIADVELGPDLELHLNFMLVPAGAPQDAAALSEEPAEPAAGFWTRRVPNRVLATWQGRPLTLRFLAIVVAAVSFPLGALTMLALGRRFGVRTRRLSPGEVGDVVLNPHRPTVGERVTPVATVGARGAEARVSFGADEIASALAERRYGLVFAALVVAPGLFALFGAALATAMIIGHEAYLLYAMLLVPLGFVVTPIIIGVQAVGRASGSR
jgi:hypothetical protein